MHDSPEVSEFQLVDSYNFQNVYLAGNGENLFANFSVSSNQGRLQTVQHLTRINQIVGEFTTDDLGQLEALVEAFYATRGGRGEKMFSEFPY
jgi:hypothetical protein